MMMVMMMMMMMMIACSGPGYWLGVGAAVTYARFLLNGVPETASYYADVYGDFVRVWIGGVPTYLTTRCVCVCVCVCVSVCLDTE